MGCSVGTFVGVHVGCVVGCVVGCAVGSQVGRAEGCAVGCPEGCVVGWPDGCAEGCPVGSPVGSTVEIEASNVGYPVGPPVGTLVGRPVGPSEGSHVGSPVGSPAASTGPNRAIWPISNIITSIRAPILLDEHTIQRHNRLIAPMYAFETSSLKRLSERPLGDPDFHQSNIVTGLQGTRVYIWRSLLHPHRVTSSIGTCWCTQSGR